MNAKGAFQMKYNGQELTPITTPQIFDPPKEMFVWDNCFGKPIIKPVYAITRREQYPVISNDSHFEYCAEIPEEQKPKRATNLQLMKWLSRGYGIWKKKKKVIHSRTHLSSKIS